jgi:hypothetical protein
MENLTSFKILTGKDILEGYKKDNYLIKNGSSSLSGSCMGDKIDFLDLYTNNKNISLGCLFVLDKIAARCIIWNTNNGQYHDYIYSNQMYFYNILENELKNNEILSTNSCCNKSYVELEKTEFTKYPYIDSFPYLLSDEKRLYRNTSYHPRNSRIKYMYCRRQDGTIDEGIIY